MPIEFRCSTCNKLLRVGDENAGKKSRCPECGNIQDIPGNPPQVPMGGPPAASYSPASGYAPAPGNPNAAHQPNSGSPNNPFSPSGNPYADRPASTNPYAASSAGYAQPQYHQPGPTPRHIIDGKVQGPAIAMMIMAILAILGWGFIVVVGVIGDPDEDAIPAVIMIMFYIGLQFLIIWGAVMMKNLKSYGLAMTAAVLSIVTSPCCTLLPMAFGIWALVVLCEYAVKMAFQQNAGKMAHHDRV